MKPITKIIISILSLLTVLNASTTSACTIISVYYKSGILLGGNEDLPPRSSFMVIDKRGKLGVIYFATPWKQWPLVMQSGINEKGLCFDINWIPKEELIPQPEKLRQNEWVITQLMQEVSTVEEALAKIFEYNWGDSISYQVHFADTSGDAAIIYPGLNGELKFSRRSKGSNYLVSTSYNHARRLRASWFGLDFPYKLLFDSKFRAADNMLSGLDFEQDLTVEFMGSVLEATHRNWWFNTTLSIKTVYSTIFDPRNLQIYLYLNRQFDHPHMIDVQRELHESKSYKKVSLADLVSHDNQQIESTLEKP